jgi:hypothetical protein
MVFIILIGDFTLHAPTKVAENVNAAADDHMLF